MGTPPDVFPDAIREYERSDGLVEGHAFSVLQVLEVTATRWGGVGGEETLRLVQLRNPWGSAKEWKYDARARAVAHHLRPSRS